MGSSESTATVPIYRHNNLKNVTPNTSYLRHDGCVETGPVVEISSHDRNSDYKIGTWNIYNKTTGKLVRIENYSFGKLNGTCINYNNNGKIINEEYWQNRFKIKIPLFTNCLINATSYWNKHHEKDFIDN
jgi:antitoxin component YwqK of YwqJK toxin-antitoxin module